jgi:hypothetical protein
MPNYPLEKDECKMFVDWLNIKGLKFALIAQETYSQSWGMKMKNKRLGGHPGLPDYMVVIPPRDDCATSNLAFVEMKRAKKSLSKVSKEQKAWQAALNDCLGVEVCIAYGAQEAKEFIESLL